MLSITQQYGYRGMGWHIDEDSKHHRTEDSTTDFANAIGGILGDTHFKLRFKCFDSTWHIMLDWDLCVLPQALQ